jgi:penicillin-binding protein 1B
VPQQQHIVLRILKRCLQGALIIVSAYVLAILAVVVWTFEVKLNRWPAFVYSAPMTVKVGDEIGRTKLFSHLTRMGYAACGDAVPEPGQWQRSGSEVSIFLKHCPLRGEGIVSGPVTMSIDWNRVRSIRLMRSLEEVDQINLEPELIHVIPGTGCEPQLCRPVPLDKVPALLVDAVVLTEDEHFFSHNGIDLGSIVRAIAANLKARRYVHGASTIPQQLIRMTVLTPDKTLTRKINEVCLALVADTLYSKRRILEAYLNRVYLGHRGAYPINGVSEGVRHLFGKDLDELDAAECALIAAMIRAPNIIASHRHPDRARERRNMVLGRLFKAGKISRETHDDALNSPVRMTKTNPVQVKAPAFVDMVRDDVPSDLPGSSIGSLRQDVLTSLDPLLQNDSDVAMKPLLAAGHEAYLLSSDPRSGEIKALLTPQGPDRWSGEGRDPAALLPFLVIPVLSEEKQDSLKYTLTSQFPVSGRSSPSLTLRRAFLEAREGLPAHLITLAGTDREVHVLKLFGIRARSTPDRGLVTDPVTPMQMAGSFGVLATLGRVVALHPGLRIADAAIPDQAPSVKRVSVQPAVLFLVNHLMKGLAPVLRKDAATDTNSAPSVFTASDKAGVWSIAYHDSSLILMRVSGEGQDKKKIESLAKRLLPMPAQGKDVPAVVPEGIVFRDTCVDSGLRATSLCPRVIREPFLKGSQPTEWCPLRHETQPKRSVKEK